uniref:Uncharacterized protein n=1 Tax=Rhizophora mucronata TaxID=61149 RepID=A0A2P2R2H1_RHIMU
MKMFNRKKGKEKLRIQFEELA